MTEIDLQSDKLREELVIGALLHDIGKFIQRSENKKEKHQKMGKEFLQNEGFSETVQNIALKHHHNQETSKTDFNYMDSKKSGNLFDWIVCISDNYSSSERSKLKSETDERINWNSDIALMSVFSKIDTHNSSRIDASRLRYLNLAQDKIYPDINARNNHTIYQTQYKGFKEDLNCIKNNLDTENLTFLLEKYLSKVPSYTAETKEEFDSPDISLFDHVKTTAAISEVIYRYIQETGKIPENYGQTENITDENIFKLIRFDISGIQDFIYTIPSKGAMKNLKTRSFYIELISEYINSGLMNKLKLSRPCVLYTGGGGGYILSHNSSYTDSKIDSFFTELNLWLFNEFSGKIFVAHKAKDFNREVFKPDKNKDKKNENKTEKENERENLNFAKLCMDLTMELGETKNRKFSESLNEIFRERKVPRSECKVCNKPLDTAPEKDNDTKCEMCKRIEDFGSSFSKNQKYLICSQEITGSEIYLEVNGLYYYFTNSEESKLKYIKKYCVNSNDLKLYKNGHTTPMYIGQFRQKNEFKELSDFTKNSIGVNGLGVLRMDVDNLGSIFKSGFRKEDQTISRFSTLSRSLNIFFKHYIHDIINVDNKEQYSLFNHDSFKKDKPAVMIIYSGGDDLFMVGAWDDVLEYSYRIRDSFTKYVCENPEITLSAGYTIVSPTFPVHIFAQVSEEQEKIAKSHKDNNRQKDSIALWDKAFFWNEFKETFNSIIKEIEGFQLLKRDGKIEIDGLGHSLFYSIIIELKRHIEEFYNEAKSKNKTDFYYIYPKLGYKLGRNYTQNKKIFEKAEYKKRAYENLTERLTRIPGNSLESIVDESEKTLTVFRILEYMHRSKINKENGGEKNG